MALLLALVGCDDQDGGDRVAEPDAGGDLGVDQGCWPATPPAAGPRACAERWLDDQGCRPRPEACAPGERADIAEGCVPVGVPACSPAWVGADGTCRPTRAAAGLRPSLRDGPVAVGVAGCAPEFLGARGCEPREEACGGGRFPVPSGCVDHRALCDDWPPRAAPDGVFVRAAAAAGGDGSFEAPLRDVEAAIALAAGRPVILDDGAYRLARLPAGLDLVGRCPERVALVGDGGAWVAAGRIGREDNVKLARVRLEGARGGIVWTGGHLRVEDVRFVGLEQGIAVGLGGVLQASGVLFADLPARAGRRGSGEAIRLEPGTRGVVERSAFVRTGSFALLANGARLDARDVWIAQSQAASPVLAVDGARVDLQDAVIAGSVRQAALVAGEGARLHLQRSGVLATRSAGDRRKPDAALDAQDNAHLIVEDTLVLGNAGISVRGIDGAHVQLTRSLVADGEPAVDGAAVGLVLSDNAPASLVDVDFIGFPTAAVLAFRGQGLHIEGGVFLEIGGAGPPVPASLATIAIVGLQDLDVAAAWIEGSLTAAVDAGFGGDVALSDTTIAAAEGWSRAGLVAGARAWRVERVDVQAGGGASLVGRGTRLVARGLRVQGGPCAEVAPAIALFDAEVQADGLSVEGACGAALVAVGSPTRWDVSRLLVVGVVAPPPEGGAAGVGVLADDVALAIDDSVIQSVAGLGLLGIGAELDVRGLDVIDTVAGPDGRYGQAIALSDGAAMRAERLGVRGGLGAGVVVLAGSLRLRGGVIQDIEPGLYRGDDDRIRAGLGDGLQIIEGTLDVEGLLVEGCARYGLMGGHAEGTVACSTLRGNGWGYSARRDSPLRLVDVALDGNLEGRRDEGEAPTLGGLGTAVRLPQPPP